mgnify:CR=1 FL=1
MIINTHHIGRTDRVFHSSTARLKPKTDDDLSPSTTTAEAETGTAWLPCDLWGADRAAAPCTDAFPGVAIATLWESVWCLLVPSAKSEKHRHERAVEK